jgi:hypothetical protein
MELDYHKAALELRATAATIVKELSDASFVNRTFPAQPYGSPLRDAFAAVLAAARVAEALAREETLA